MWKRRWAAAAVFAAGGFYAHRALAILSSDPSTLTGVNINDAVGANTFYSNGFTGSGTIIANIEPGVAWTGQESLSQGQVIQDIASGSITGSAGWSASPNAWTDRHATWTAQTLVGEGSNAYQMGIAYGASLVCGAIASSWNSVGQGSYSTSFNSSDSTVLTPYVIAMQGYLNGDKAANVVSSSWGGGVTDGSDNVTQTIDGLIASSGITVVVAAGNSGSMVGDPANGFNCICVGATTADTDGYSGVASFSSRSPNPVFDPTLKNGAGGFVANARACVDLVAPGTNLTLAAYVGGTGGNAFGGATSNTTNSYYTQVSGTSFSAPIVAGGADLLVQAGQTLYPGNAKAADARVVKAVLMNSATKLSGWNNGQALSNGVITTSQSLDYTQGAGALNLTQAYSQYTAGTNDVPGLGGGTVQAVGWDYGSCPANGANNYAIASPLAAGSTFAVTLDWFADDPGGSDGGVGGYGAFDNLDLQVWSDVNGVAQSLVATSDSKYNSAEELYFSVPAQGDYLIRVLDAGYNWNGLNGVTDTTTDYGLAWNTVAVPEPGSGAVLAGGWMAVMARRRRGRRVDQAG